jgi:hypothetical protein
VKLYHSDCLSIAGSGAAAPGALGTPLGIETGGGDLQGNSLEPPCKLFLGGAAAPGALVPPPPGGSMKHTGELLGPQMQDVIRKARRDKIN